MTVPLRLLTNRVFNHYEIIKQLLVDILSALEAQQSWKRFIAQKTIFTELHFYTHYKNVRGVRKSKDILVYLREDINNKRFSDIETALEKAIRAFIAGEGGHSDPNSLMGISHELSRLGHSPALNIIEIAAFLTPPPPEVPLGIYATALIEYIKDHCESYAEQIAVFRNYLYICTKDEDIKQYESQMKQAMQMDDPQPLQDVHYIVGFNFVKSYHGVFPEIEESEKWDKRAEYIRGTLSILTQSKQAYYANDTLHIVIKDTSGNSPGNPEKIKKLTPRLHRKLSLRSLPAIFQILGSANKKQKEELLMDWLLPQMSLSLAVLAEICTEAGLDLIDSPQDVQGNYDVEIIKDKSGERKEVYSYAPQGTADVCIDYGSWDCTAEVSVNRKTSRIYRENIQAGGQHAKTSDYVLLLSPNIPDDPDIIRELKRWNQDDNAPSIVPMTLAVFSECMQCIHDLQVKENEQIPDTVIKDFYENIAKSVATQYRAGEKVETQIRGHISNALGNLARDFNQHIFEKNRGHER